MTADVEVAVQVAAAKPATAVTRPADAGRATRSRGSAVDVRRKVDLPGFRHWRMFIA